MQAAAAVAEAPASTALLLPKLNTHVPGKGIFRGLIPDPAGGPDRCVYQQAGHLDDGTWQECMDQATALREEGRDDWRLPTRPEAALCYAVAKDDHKGWYWTSEQYASAPDFAWVQDFLNGLQTTGWKGYDDRARAVRSEPLQ